MKFYASATVSPSTLDRLYEELSERYGSLDPIDPLIYTPIEVGDKLTRRLKEYSEEGLRVMFDSGGYSVQTSGGDFEELYNRLMPFYEDNRWGYRYVLPDNVPVSGDDQETVDQKVEETRTNARLSYYFLPDELKPKAVPVIQGNKYGHITDCIETYARLNRVQMIGFGSFETFGANNGVNIISQDVAETLRYAVNLAHNHDFELHALGVGGPTAIPILAELGVDSFDCSSWIRAGGYGDIYFPFRTPKHASHKTDRDGPKLFENELSTVKRKTGHHCPFCETHEQLRNSRFDRILHNLVVLHEMSRDVEECSSEALLDQMTESSRYHSVLDAISD